VFLFLLNSTFQLLQSAIVRLLEIIGWNHPAQQSHAPVKPGNPERVTLYAIRHRPTVIASLAQQDVAISRRPRLLWFQW